MHRVSSMPSVHCRVVWPWPCCTLLSFSNQVHSISVSNTLCCLVRPFSFMFIPCKMSLFFFVSVVVPSLSDLAVVFPPPLSIVEVIWWLLPLLVLWPRLLLGFVLTQCRGYYRTICSLVFPATYIHLLTCCMPWLMMRFPPSCGGGQLGVILPFDQRYSKIMSHDCLETPIVFSALMK